MSIITLTTDFGLNDWFVGVMKGVILGINSHATVVDLTQGIPSGDIRAGALALAAGFRFFPRGTVHLAVVDPGVGSNRGAIAVETKDYFFVGPDNGVLSFALRREKIKTIRRLDEERYFLKPVSATFHGRDIFAPVAAHLSKGLACHNLGTEREDFVRLPWPRPTESGGSIRGEIVYLDRFGNAITNIENAVCPPASGARIFIRGKAVAPMRPFYQAAPAGKPVAVPGSSGFWELAVNGGNAARQLGLKVGSPIILKPRR